MLQELKWDTLETMRRHTGLSVIYKMCYDVIGGGMEGLFDSKWRKENTRRGTLGGTQYRNTVGKNGKYRNTASKIV